MSYPMYVSTEWLKSHKGNVLPQQEDFWMCTDLFPIRNDSLGNGIENWKDYAIMGYPTILDWFQE